MGISALSSGLSGMQAQMRSLDVQAHNVANLSSEGFSPRAATFSEASPPGSGVTFSAQGLSMAAGNNPAASIVEGLAYVAGFQLSAKVVKAASERLGSLLDMTA